jgi:hypothetical protein
MSSIEANIAASIAIYESIGAVYARLQEKSEQNRLQGIEHDLDRLYRLFAEAEASDNHILLNLDQEPHVSGDMLSQWSDLLYRTREQNQTVTRHLSTKLLLYRDELQSLRQHKAVMGKYQSGLPRTGQRLESTG